MTHLEALEEVIKYQKEKLAIQEAKILTLEAEVLKAKAEPKYDYLSYLEKQRNCQHEFESRQGFTLSGWYNRKCKKCDYVEPMAQTNGIMSGGVLNIPNSGQWSLITDQLVRSGYAQTQNIYNSNYAGIPEERRNRG